MLPHDVDFTPTGESPLSKNADFVDTECPQCGGPAKREVDILDTFVSSAWYALRFPDPHNEKELVSHEAIHYWGTVDHYQGTIEHLTAHLVYARFVTKVLFDHGLVPFDEPFPKYTPVGLLVDKVGTKFSKRLGNAPDTNELIEQYGGDILRLSCSFITPFDDISRWGMQDVVGVEKFRNRMWRVFTEKVDGESHATPEAITRQLHQLIKSVGEGIEKMRYNVAISKMMVFVSELANHTGNIDKEVWETFTKVLAPFAPFIAEEMWSMMGHQESVHMQSWPRYDQRYIEQRQVTITIQVNGKVREHIEVAVGSSKKEVVSHVMKIENLWEQAKKADTVIFVQDKVINFVNSQN
jgi:leucyl-tRNA synthetase